MWIVYRTICLRVFKSTGGDRQISEPPSRQQLHPSKNNTPQGSKLVSLHKAGYQTLISWGGHVRAGWLAIIFSVYCWKPSSLPQFFCHMTSLSKFQSSFSTGLGDMASIYIQFHLGASGLGALGSQDVKFLIPPNKSDLEHISGDKFMKKLQWVLEGIQHQTTINKNPSFSQDFMQIGLESLHFPLRYTSTSNLNHRN